MSAAGPKVLHFFRQLRRESRGSGVRLLFFVLCLAVGVAAVVAVASFSSGLETGIRREARSLLAADLAIRGRQPAEPAFLEAVDALPGSARADLMEMLTVVAAEAPDGSDTPGASQLTELKAVEGDYPFYGNLVLEPAARLSELLSPSAAVVGPELLDRLDLEIGDTLRIGGQPFEIAGVVSEEPDRVAGAFSLGPRLFLSGAGVERAGLERYGSRIVYRTLVRLPEMGDTELAATAESLGATLENPSAYRLETYREAQPALRKGLESFEAYIGLAALLSLIIGGVGVAQTVRSWLAGRMDAIAIYRCLGYKPNQVARLYLAQTAVMALVASTLGVALGVLLMAVPRALLTGVLPVEHLDPIQPLAWLQGLGLGTGVALLFAYPPIAAARRVPPIRVLRRSAEPLPQSRAAVLGTGALLIAGVFALAWWQSKSQVDGGLFTAGLLASAALLAGAATVLARLAAKPRRRAGLWLRQGLAALSRPGAGTLGGIVALGLGVLVVLAMHLVERGLLGELERDLPDEAPTAFLVDIQTDQWPGVQELLSTHGAAHYETAPVVMGRFKRIDGRPVSEIIDEREAQERKATEDDDTWALRRELRMTYLDGIGDDNQITDGSLWNDPGPEVSLEEEFAANLGVTVGSQLVFDIQGVEVEMKVTSLRSVDWSSFGINFFIVAEPGVLDEAPQSRLAAARIGKQDTQELQDALAAAYPNVTMIQIREVMERVSALLERLALGVRVLGWLTVLVGLAILAGAISAAAVRRGREVALYKTLGMTRKQVMGSFAVEYALVGLVAGVIGAAGATVLASVVLERGMEVENGIQVAAIPTALVLTIVLSVVAGLAASSDALRKRPIEVLRSEAG
ncbi:MAG: FtsX-like permease family protein [Acidobacteriota bacterium]